jgi:hypothetical protein
MVERDHNHTAPVTLTKSGDVSPLLYPDVHLAGGLVALLQQLFESVGQHVKVSALWGWGGPDGARVEVEERFSQVYVAAEKRLFVVDFWSRGVCLVKGAFSESEVAAHAIHCWACEHAFTRELASRFPELVVDPEAEAFDEGREVEQRWRNYLERPPFPELGAVIRAAAALPELRMLFPFTSMTSLWFRRCTGYPYTTDCPVIAPSGSGRYSVRLPNRTTSYALAAEDAARFVVANLPQGCRSAIPGTARSLGDAESRP